MNMVSKQKLHVHKILSPLRKLINLPINKVQRLSSFFFLYQCLCLFWLWVCLAEFPLQVCLFIDFSVRSTAQVLNIKTLIFVNRLSRIIQSLVRWTTSKTLFLLIIFIRIFLFIKCLFQVYFIIILIILVIIIVSSCCRMYRSRVWLLHISCERHTLSRVTVFLKLWEHAAAEPSVRFNYLFITSRDRFT